MFRRDRRADKLQEPVSKSVSGVTYLPRREWPRPLTEDNVSERRYREGGYADTGCSERGEVISTSCLECPLPQCKYDDLEGATEWLQARRSVKVESRKGISQRVKELARELGVTERTVWRRLKGE
jgi:hypothetical protein